MSIVEISGLIQSGVLSGVVIMIVYRFPAMWAAIMQFVEKSRQYHAEQDALDRESYRLLAANTAESLKYLTLAIHELKTATQNFCKYRP